MKTQNNKLSFNTNTMVELNNEVLLDINGGSTPTTASSGWCLAAAGAGLAYLLR